MTRWILISLFLLASCESDRSAGTGSQTGNSVVAGRILRADSLPAANVEITLAPASWGKTIVRTRHTDSLGRYRFDAVDAGLWRLETRGEKTAMVRTLRLQAGRDSTLPTLLALPRGKVVVEIHLDDTLRTGWLKVMGMSDSVSLANPAREVFLSFANLAPGVQWFTIVGPGGRHLREASLLARSGQVDTLLDAKWKRESAGPAADGAYDPDDDGDDDAEDD